MKTKPFLKVYIAVVTLACAIWASAESVQVVVREAQGRSGPGSFYPLVVLIPEKTKLDILDRKKSWCKVNFKDLDTCWVAENSLSTEEAKAPDSPLSSMTTTAAVSITASPATLTAAIKGFWTRYSRTDKRKLAELPVNGYDVPPESYTAFSENRSTVVGQDKLHKKYRLSSKFKKSRFKYEKEHSIGYTIASSIAEGTLYEDERVVEYIQEVGWYIAESTERYDIRFIFYVLDTDRINAVSCPGGYVVLTRGLLDKLHDEAELAALLAHEMAHVIAGHAMQSMEEDKTRITADSAFDALDKETQSEPGELEEELIAITNRAVSIATSPKLDEQEYEADRMALRYLARSGYDLNGLPRLLNTLMTEHEQRIDMFDLNYRNHPDFKERLRRVERELREYRNYEGRTFDSDFEKNMML